MTAYQWLSVVTCAGHLALAILSVLRSARSPLAPPLAFLCTVMFGWNFATLAHQLSGQPEWRYLDVSISPLTTPAALHVIVTFVGERRRLSWVLLLGYLVLGGLSLLSISAFFWPWARGFAGSTAWAVTHALFVVPLLLLAVALVLRHLRRQSGAEEQMRTRLVLTALLVGGLFTTTELWADMGLQVPRLGNIASLCITGLLALVALRFRLFDRELSFLSAIYSLVLASAAVGAYLAVFRALAASRAVLAVATITITFVLIAIVRQSVSAVAAQRAHMERLAVLGKLSAQMAHDLKNPLAALKGAAQFLSEERAQGRSIDGQEPFLKLMVEEIDRLARLVDKYRRLGKLEPSLEDTDINEMVRSVISLQRFGSSQSVELRTELEPDLPPCPVDPDLLSTALENLVANALQAMPQGGTVTIRTELGRDATQGDCVLVTVADTGSGMNARQMERAFDEFFTTRAQGSGLGLAFVRQVAEAHGGRATLASREGEGTEVNLCFILEKGVTK